MNTVKQSRFKHLGELHKEWTEAGVSASRVTTLRHLQEKGYQTTSETETSSEASYLGWGEKELDCCRYWFCISFGNQGPRVWRKSGEAQNPCCLKSSVKFPQSVMIWAAMPSAGVGPLCFLKSTVNADIYQDILEHFMLPSDWQALWRCRFYFPAGLDTCPHCQRYQKLVHWPRCYCDWLTSKLAWPEPHWESRWETPDLTMQMTWRPLSKQSGLHYTWAVSQADCLHATPHWCSNSCKRSPNQVLSL